MTFSWPSPRGVGGGRNERAGLVDELVQVCERAGLRVEPDPSDPGRWLIFDPLELTDVRASLVPIGEIVGRYAGEIRVARS